MVSDAESQETPQDGGPRISWAIVLMALGMAAALAATYADIRATIAVQGTKIETVQRSVDSLQRDVRIALGIDKR